MPSIINATSGGSGGLITSGDTSGTLEIQTGGTTAISVDASQNVAAAGNVTVTGSLTAGSYVGIPNNSLGVGQTWQNVSGSRTSNGTTYTNSTSKPIMVAFTPGGAASLNVSYTVDGVSIASVYISSSNAIYFPFSFVVPAGSTYSITSSQGTSNWAELR